MYSAAGLHVQIASMKAGFSAYTQAVKHHSLMLNRQQHRIDELEDSNKKKDATISGLEESRVKMAEEHEEARVRMTAAIEDMERRMNEMQQNNGTKKTNLLTIDATTKQTFPMLMISQRIRNSECYISDKEPLQPRFVDQIATTDTTVCKVSDTDFFKQKFDVYCVRRHSIYVCGALGK